MRNTPETLKNGIELLQNRRLHFKITIGTLQEQIDKYQKEIEKIDYQIFKTKEILEKQEPNIDL